MVRECTNKLIEFAENESISWEDIARECLERMSEDDVKDMCEDAFDEVIYEDDDVEDNDDDAEDLEDDEEA